jgi:hypothetical protein
MSIYENFIKVGEAKRVYNDCSKWKEVTSPRSYVGEATLSKDTAVCRHGKAINVKLQSTSSVKKPVIRSKYPRENLVTLF